MTHPLQKTGLTLRDWRSMLLSDKAANALLTAIMSLIVLLALVLLNEINRRHGALQQQLDGLHVATQVIDNRRKLVDALAGCVSARRYAESLGLADCSQLISDIGQLNKREDPVVAALVPAERLQRFDRFRAFLSDMDANQEEVNFTRFLDVIRGTRTLGEQVYADSGLNVMVDREGATAAILYTRHLPHVLENVTQLRDRITLKLVDGRLDEPSRLDAIRLHERIRQDLDFIDQVLRAIDPGSDNQNAAALLAGAKQLRLSYGQFETSYPMLEQDDPIAYFKDATELINMFYAIQDLCGEFTRDRILALLARAQQQRLWLGVVIVLLSGIFVLLFQVFVIRRQQVIASERQRPRGR